MYNASAHIHRLDIPGMPWKWRTSMRLAGPAYRRDEFMGLVRHYWLGEADTLAKMRSLLDLGIWQDVDRCQVHGDSGLSSGFPRLSHALFLTPRSPPAPKDILPKAKGALKELTEIMFQHISSGQSDLILLHLLFEAGVCIDAYDNDNRQNTPLTWAISQGNQETIDFLLDLGADPDLVTGRGDISPLCLIARYPVHPDWPFDKHAAIESMMARGVDINSPGHTKEGGAPRYPRYAVEAPCDHGNLDFLKWMIQKGADIKIPPDIVLSTVRGTNKDLGAKEIVEYLIESGATFDPHINPGTLTRAIEYRCLDIALYLLRISRERGQSKIAAQDILSALVRNTVLGDPVVKEFLDEVEIDYPDMWSTCLPDGTPLIESLLEVCQNNGEHGDEWRSFLEHFHLAKCTAPSTATQVRRL